MADFTSKYHLFNIWVLLWQLQENWLILSPLRVWNSSGNDTGSQKTAELLCWNVKERNATWGRKKSQKIPAQIINVGGIY